MRIYVSDVGIGKGHIPQSCSSPVTGLALCMLEQQELASLQLSSTPLLLDQRAEIVFALSPY